MFSLKSPVHSVIPGRRFSGQRTVGPELPVLILLRLQSASVSKLTRRTFKCQATLEAGLTRWILDVFLTGAIIKIYSKIIIIHFPHQRVGHYVLNKSGRTSGPVLPYIRWPVNVRPENSQWTRAPTLLFLTHASWDSLRLILDTCIPILICDHHERSSGRRQYHGKQCKVGS
jgi:hypothetical protein